MTAWWVVGDTRDVTALIPDASIDLILTSPPFLALRSYLPAGHVDKHREIGSEGTPAAFVDMLLGLTAEWRRILTPTGSMVIELGDTYSGSGGAGGDYADDGLREGQPKFRQGTPRWDGRPAGQIRTTTSDPVSYPARARDGWPLDKSLCLIPELYRIGLVYGLNPLTGQTSPAGRFRGRNVVRWVRPNPPVGALGDKWRPATSDLIVACTAKDRYFDLDATRVAHSDNSHRRTAKGVDRAPNNTPSGQRDGNWNTLDLADDPHPAGAPPLDWWQIVPGGFGGAHYAVFPAELCVKPIEAMCPRRVCVACSKPSRRVVEGQRVAPKDDGTRLKTAGPLARSQGRPPEIGWEYDRMTTGWSSCGCPGTDGLQLDGYHTGTGWRPGRVLDPFAGSGTVAAVASGHGRDSVGIDIDSRNADLARERVGMFLEPVSAADLADRLRDGAVEGVA